MNCWKRLVCRVTRHALSTLSRAGAAGAGEGVARSRACCCWTRAAALIGLLREQLSVEVRQIVHRSHTTAIYVTHDQDEAFTVADTVAIMHEGNLAWIGTPQDVWMDPQTVTVARFLGYGPILNPEQASQFGVHVPDGKLLACGPDAWRPAAEGDAEGGVATRIVEGRTVRGAEEVLVEFSDGVTATVSLPIGTDLGTRLNIALDDRKCAVVTA